jgi:hypothetical protein
VFFHASYETQPGPGYVSDVGKLSPGVNLWAWRDFVRRSAILQHSLGKKSTAIYMHSECDSLSIDIYLCIYIHVSACLSIYLFSVVLGAD